MEKLKFTLRFVVLLAALPVIMFTELVRKDAKETQKVSVEKNSEAMLNHSPFMQAVYN